MSWRRYLSVTPRFSMRTLLSVMLIAAVFFAWFGWRLRKAQRQAHAVAVLARVGALWTYDYQVFDHELGQPRRTQAWLGKPIGVSGKSGYSRRLRELLGVDFLHNVTRVHLERSERLSDQDIDRVWDAIADLPDLVYLEASGPVTRPGVIQRLRPSRRLRRLALRWANLADEDLAVLDRLSRLEELNLNETPVTNAALEHVGRRSSLQAIELHHTAITDAGMADIARLPNLRRLRLSGTEVGDEGIRHLGASTSLRDLNLEHTRITDEGMRALARLVGLQQLDLSLNAITEKGCVHLAELTSLTHLEIEGTTTVGPQALEVLPKLPQLETLRLDGPLVAGDLSPISRCQNLRVLSCALGRGEVAARGLKLPPKLEEIDGVQLSDGEVFDQLAALEGLRLIRTSYNSFNPDELAQVNRFKALRPNVQIWNR